MREFDRPVKTAPPSLARLGDLNRFSDPATLVCAALALAVLALSVRIFSIW